MEVTYHHVPYDLDYFWDGGCNESDIIDDMFGDTVHLFTSDSGSAYVCPEKIEEDWRLYVDAYGRAFRLTARAGDAQQTTPYKDMRSTYDAIRECGMTVYPNLPAPSRDGDDPPLLIKPDQKYLKTDLGSWPFEISYGSAKLGDGEDRIAFTNDGMVWGRKWEMAYFYNDPGYEIREKLFPYLLSPFEISELIEELAGRREGAEGTVASTLLYIEKQLGRCMETHEEIFAFEEACMGLIE